MFTFYLKKSSDVRVSFTNYEYECVGLSSQTKLFIYLFPYTKVPHIAYKLHQLLGSISVVKL